jgi:hypothetical protein
MAMVMKLGHGSYGDGGGDEENDDDEDRKMGRIDGKLWRW